MNTPTTYQIHIRGRLDETWSRRLGGMTITPIKSGEKGDLTLLSGTVADQATLLGVLLALYDMQLPLVSVACMDE